MKTLNDWEVQNVTITEEAINNMPLKEVEHEPILLSIPSTVVRQIADWEAEIVTIVENTINALSLKEVGHTLLSIPSTVSRRMLDFTDYRGIRRCRGCHKPSWLSW